MDDRIISGLDKITRAIGSIADTLARASGQETTEDKTRASTIIAPVKEKFSEENLSPRAKEVIAYIRSGKSLDAIGAPDAKELRKFSPAELRVMVNNISWNASVFDF